MDENKEDIVITRAAFGKYVDKVLPFHLKRWNGRFTIYCTALSDDLFQLNTIVYPKFVGCSSYPVEARLVNYLGVEDHIFSIKESARTDGNGYYILENKIVKGMDFIIDVYSYQYTYTFNPTKQQDLLFSEDAEERKKNVKK